MIPILRMSEAEAWAELVAAVPDLARHNPARAPDGRNVSWDLELEVRQHRALFARHIQSAIAPMADDQVASWLGAVLSTPNEGFLNEAYAYGVLAERGFRFECPYRIDSGQLYRAHAGAEVKLDGRFTDADVMFDLKSLLAPERIARRLLAAANDRLAEHGMVAAFSGTLDFDYLAVGDTEFSRQLRFICNHAQIGRRIELPDWRLVFTIYSATHAPPDSELEFRADRFAASNRHFFVSDAKQIPRSGKFVLSYTYLGPYHPFFLPDTEPRRAERLFSRRSFIELSRNTKPVVRYCGDADPKATVADIVRSIGGILFVGLDRERNATVRLHLNPNAGDGQKLTMDDVHAMTRADGAIDEVIDFEYDNY